MAISHRGKIAILFLAVFVSLGMRASGADLPISSPSLDRGFHLLYDLEFDRAHEVFAGYERDHVDDPMGPVGEAAGLLFAEFDRLGVLEAQFYEDNKKFEARKKFDPNPTIRDRFDEALHRAEALAHHRLAKDPRDRAALFAMVMASGLTADYAALVEKRNLASLHYTKEATNWAEQLLAVDPQCYDAHLAIGISQYVVGSLAAPLRWLVRLGGISGDKAAGIGELQLAADKGRYLAPFARILLAIAYVREKDGPRAREMLIALRDDFPENPLFTRELRRLDARP